MAERIVQVTSSIELMSPPGLHDVLKTLEHFGIYQRFECIKCHQDLSTINLALAHLRGEYLECKSGNVDKSTLSSDGAQNVQRVGEKEVFAPRKPKNTVSPKNVKKEVPSSSSSHKKGSKYSLKHIEMILNKRKKDDVFAKQFGITIRDVHKLRYTWKNHKKYKNLLLTVPTPKNIVAITKHVKNPHKQSVTSKKPKGKLYNVNKSANSSQDYKIQPGEEAP